MDDMLQVLGSPAYKHLTHSLAFVCLLLAVGFVVVAFAYYGRASDISGKTPEEQRWTLLMGTWRDSLIITVLYLSEAMVYRFSTLQGASGELPGTLLLYGPAINDIAAVCIYIAIFAVAILRIILISRWLSEQKTSA